MEKSVIRDDEPATTDDPAAASKYRQKKFLSLAAYYILIMDTAIAVFLWMFRNAVFGQGGDTIDRQTTILAICVCSMLVVGGVIAFFTLQKLAKR